MIATNEAIHVTFLTTLALVAGGVDPGRVRRAAKRRRSAVGASLRRLVAAASGETGVRRGSEPSNDSQSDSPPSDQC
jgi:hypothetical protein